MGKKNHNKTKRKKDNKQEINNMEIGQEFNPNKQKNDNMEIRDTINSTENKK